MIGLSGGFALPADTVLEDGKYFAVSGERFVTPRVSVKAQFGGAFLDVVGNGLHGNVSPWHLSGGLAYNWERGKWHPYAGGGVGYYKYRFGEGANRPSATKGGVHLGGGLEYFFTRTDTISGDLTLHVVPGTADAPGFGYKPRFWTVTAGYKKYF